MDTLLPFVESRFGGVRLTVKPSKKRLSRKERALSITVANLVEWWLNEPKNKLTILNLLYQSGVYGTGIGTITDNGASFQPIDFKSFVSPATKSKRAKKTS